MDLVHAKKDADILQDALGELKALKMENERLRQDACQAPVSSQPASSYKVFYQIRNVLYLDEPCWEPSEGSSVILLANNPIRRLEHYLDQHPEIAFAIYKDYKQDLLVESREIETVDGIYRSPTPTHEALSFVSPDMRSAVKELIQQIPRFDYYFPRFNLDQEIPAPYLFMYYSTPFIAGVLPKLSTRSRNLIKQLQAVVAESYGHEYTSVKLQVEKGMIARKYLKYLVRPGDVLVSTATEGNIPQACIARGWIEAPETTLEDPEFKEWVHVGKRLSEGHDSLVNSISSHKMTKYVWKVPVWYWSFDGNFGRHETSIDIMMSLANEGDSVDIRSLNHYPLQYAAAEIRSLLEKRGKTFWSLRNRRFVSYMRSEEDELYNIEDRYIVDTKSFKMLFPDSNIAQMRLKQAFSATVMANDQPPEEGDALLAVPSTIMAHNLQEKVWRELLVDQITDINWNKQAFKDLVAEPETKELVQALVMKQINARRSTDFVAGKGNGLIMLLHGAPGTGKTFTAEGVAEFAEKPLLRITCGDIGTEPEVVDQRLRATLRLGKLWDCVVLLDEADVFLEERDMKDLKRNALVSVFLRALEYYDGILILTSNRVGTFDEAFKSRIQLALHYDNLGIVQRKKIWRNFITRMKKLEESSSADLEDILDHIDELSKEPMNGREIRNAITIARQLAQFREQRFEYSHLKHAMNVGSRFSKYLNDLRMNYTDDMIKQDSGIRFSYTAVAPAGLQ
ncbi:P-loop containing nucleoside triphosphate hydrolase protein [Alternaria alternata]|nr:P-loop containing nucleoside triphosphate hydrolase protein [Alternaria alternata]